MGLFSAKKKETTELKVPVPSKSGLSPFSFKGQNQTDDLDNLDFSRQTTNSEATKTNSLAPALLGEAQRIDIRLPTFSTAPNHAIDLDKIESELSIKKDTTETKTAVVDKAIEEINQTIPDLSTPKADFSQSTQGEIHFSNEEREKINTEIPNLEEEEIPEEIEDIPDHISSLDIDEDIFELEHDGSLEPKKSVFVGINTIKKITSDSKNIREKIHIICERKENIEENIQKQQDALLKSKNLYEDMERKILFVNKTLFSEE